MANAVAIPAWVLAAILFSEFFGYLLHRLLHSGWIPFLSVNHTKHHLVLYGPQQKQRPSGKYLDATTGRDALGNIGLEWILPAGILLALMGLLFSLLSISAAYQFLFFGIALAWTVWVFSYLHDRMHIKDFWMERAPVLKHWFCWARRLNNIHHRVLNDRGLMHTNFGIRFAFFDWLFGTLQTVQPPFNRAGFEMAKQKFAFVSRSQSDVRPGRSRNPFHYLEFQRRTNMRKTAVLSNLLLAVIAWLLTPAQLTFAQSGLVMYDNFNQRFLDPSKWLTSSPCFTWTVLECAREIQNGQLRLEVRGYGATNANTGSQYGQSELHFLNPNRVNSIASQLVVRRTSAASCAASTDQNSGTQAILQGNFFNSGSGVPSDDVQALLFFNHLPSDSAGVLTVVALLNWQGQFFGGTELGTINVGQRISAQLSWDKRNHQFIAGWTDLASGVVTKASLPYTIPDTAPAAMADKLLGVRVFTPNCIGTRMLVDDVETTFDNVMIGGFDN